MIFSCLIYQGNGVARFEGAIADLGLAVIENFPTIHTKELEKKNYWIPKRGAKGVENVAAGVAIVVQREKYQGWDLEVLLDSKFYLWRNKERIRPCTTPL